MSEADRRKWDARYLAHGRPPEPSGFLASLDGLLPRRGRALDVAGGTGRNALWLARRGLVVTLADISVVAIRIARGQADAAGLPVRTVAADLETEPLPAGPWDLVVCVDFLLRPLIGSVPTALAPGGLFVISLATRSNLQRHLHPGPDYLLDDGELPGLVAGLDLVSYEEGWTAEGRHEARLVARRPANGPG